MRRFVLVLLVVLLGFSCQDNTHPPPLGNEVHNHGMFTITLAVGGTATTVGVGGAGGEGTSTATGIGGSPIPNNCDCVAAWADTTNTPGCAQCFNTQAAATCEGAFNNCDNTSGCDAINNCIQAAAGNPTAQEACFFSTLPSAAETVYVTQVLACACPLCAAQCTPAVPIVTCVAQPTTSSSSSGMAGSTP